MANGELVEGSLYFYAPARSGAVAFTVLFFVTALVHTWYCFVYKAWKITALHPFCSLLFTVGFALRSYDAYNFDSLNTYIASTILIYTAPPLLELANYHVLGRILYYIPYHAPLHPGRTLTTFGSISFVVEILNALGVAYLANPNVDEKFTKIGQILMKASLITQLVVLLSFAAMCLVFHRRCIKTGIKSRRVQGPLWTMYISTVLIMIRTIYRVIEHFGQSQIPRNPGPDFDYKSLTPLIRYEWYFYVFEAILMLCNSTLWIVRYPRRYLPEDYHVYLAQDGQTELQGPGWTDDVPWWMTFIDPCGLTAAIMGGGRKKRKPFWEENGYEHQLLKKGGSRNSDEEARVGA